MNKRSMSGAFAPAVVSWGFGSKGSGAKRIGSKRLLAGAAVVASVGATSMTQAAPILLTGAAYTQNFDSLPGVTATPNPAAWIQESTLAGWSAYGVPAGATGGTAVDITSILVSAGGVATGSLYSFGTGSTSSTNTDRALGSLVVDSFFSNNAGTVASSIYYVARFRNDTGGPISSINITYTGEQWRTASGQPAQSLQFQYYTDSTVPDFGRGPGQGGWSATVSELTFSTPTTGQSSSAALVGNDAANRRQLSSTLPITIAPGAEFYFRWRDLNDPGADHAVAIDDLTITYVVVPEPAHLGLLALPTAMLARRRGRR